MAKVSEDLLNYFKQIDNKYNLTPGSIKAVGTIESSLDANAKAEGSTAKGMFQIVDGTAKSLGLKNPYDPYEAADAAGLYLSRLKKMFDGDEQKAVLAYHAGPGNVMKFGFDTSKMPESVNRKYLQKFNKTLGKSEDSSYNSESTYSEPKNITASQEQSYAIPETLDSALGNNSKVPTIDNQSQTFDNGSVDGTLAIPETLDIALGADDKGVNNDQNNSINNNIPNSLSQQGNVQSESVPSNSIPNNSIPTQQSVNLNTNNNQPDLNFANTTNQNSLGTNINPPGVDNMAIPGNPIQNNDSSKQLFDKFASLDPNTQVSFYQNLDQSKKNILLNSIKKNVGENPEVDHPGIFKNFIIGALNRGNQISGETSQLLARAGSGIANMVGLDGIGNSLENTANNISKDLGRNKAVNELNDAANPSLSRDAGSLSTDIGATFLTPIAGAKGKLLEKAGKYALSGAGIAILTSPTIAENNDDYFNEKLKDAIIGGAGGAIGGTVGDKATSYISAKFGNQISSKAAALKEWADSNGINVSAFAFPEVRQSLLNFLQQNGRDERVAKVITDSNDSINSFSKLYQTKNFGNEFGDYFTNSAGDVVTPTKYVQENFPKAFDRLGEFTTNKRIEYGSKIDSAIQKLSNPKSNEEVFGALAQINLIERKINSSNLYKNVDPDMAKVKFSGTDLKDSLRQNLSFELNNGNSETTKVIDNILKEISPKEDVSALKVVNIGSLFSKKANEAEGKSIALYNKASAYMDNYLQEKAAADPKFATLLQRHNESQSFNKVAVQDLQADSLSKEAFNTEFDNLQKVARSDSMRSINNIWSNLDTASQKSLQNFMYTKALSNATDSRTNIMNASVLSNQLNKLLDSKVGSVVFKNHQEDLKNLATISKNIDINLSKSVRNGSLITDALGYLKGSAGAIGATTVVAGQQMQSPLLMSSGAALAAWSLFLKNNSMKIISSDKLRNDLFEISNVDPKSEIFGQLTSAFIRNVANSAGDSAYDGRNNTSQDLTQLNQLRQDRNVDNNQSQNNNLSIEQLKAQRGIK